MTPVQPVAKAPPATNFNSLELSAEEVAEIKKNASAQLRIEKKLVGTGSENRKSLFQGNW